MLDLDYAEDSAADADANFVMTGSGGIVEVQGTAETVPFSQEGFDQLMALAKKGIAELISLQKLTVAMTSSPRRRGEGTRDAWPPEALCMIPTGILETVLYAKDLAAAETFYRDVLGLASRSRKWRAAISSIAAATRCC